MTDGQALLLSSLGVSLEAKRSMQLEDWDGYSLNHNSQSRDAPIILVESGPKTIADIKRMAKRFDTCVIISHQLKRLFIKTLEKTHPVSLESDTEYVRISEILKSYKVSTAKSDVELSGYLDNVIDAIPNTTGDFENRGLFSTHYLRNRIFDDAPGVDVSAFRDVTGTERLLELLGWKKDSIKGMAKVIVTGQENFSILEDGSVTPSHMAVSELASYKYVILTNGTKWRLYTNRVSASTTNYFEIYLDGSSDRKLQYLHAIFGYGSFAGREPKIDLFFDRGREFATDLEENLASRIMSQDGVLLYLAKGILDHDMKEVFSKKELASAKETALHIIYRLWFVAYAESRNLLPVSHTQYAANMSLRNLRSALDYHEENADDLHSCWKYLLNLFEGIRNGSPKNNLPQYNGLLFRHDENIDGITIQNKWLVPAVRDLLERDGDSIDYASMGVRHLGNILESVMEFSIQQAREDIMLLVKNNKITQVKTSKESNYSYKKNDLYLASKGGLVVRKSTASYYTPDEIVRFLVERGLHPILEDRSAKLAHDVKLYCKEPTPENRTTCMERLLDIQVLDPAMGSGHFLVEALNHITSWATEMIKRHPQHPVLEELRDDRNTILEMQKKNNITLDENLLTYEVLLKRKVMKRCIFGVDINPMAVEISKLALWLDSFAIGVPLTYMDHHVREGDSTIGMFLGDIESTKNQSLDTWMPRLESDEILEDVWSSPDITVSQVHHSEAKYDQYQRSISSTRQVLDALAASQIDDSIMPKKSGIEFVRRLGLPDNDDITNKVHKNVQSVASRHKFFHWELEMRDAFTDSRRGFDVILGNPPWDKSKPNDDEFFTPYIPAFTTLSPKPKKNKAKDRLLQDPSIKAEYDSYTAQFREKNAFYSTYKKQGSGDKELSKLIFERSLDLLSDNGIISMVMPSQILSSVGSVDIRKEMLDRNIIQLFVFENRNKIFDIHSSYRFMLLTLKNPDTVTDAKGQGDASGNKFHVGFYLHHLSSLYDASREASKFGYRSKEQIRKIFPESLIIPESIGDTFNILEKMYRYPKLGGDIGNGMTISFSSGFHKTNDADLFSDGGGVACPRRKDHTPVQPYLEQATVYSTIKGRSEAGR